MPVELIKLKIKKESSSGEQAHRIIDKLLEACLTLDCTVFEPMINEDQNFDDVDKYRFLASLKQQFHWAIARGAKDISMKKGKCEMCLIGHSTYEFYGENNTPEYAYIINSKNDEVQDIFLCNMSSGWNLKG